MNLLITSLGVLLNVLFSTIVIVRNYKSATNILFAALSIDIAFWSVANYLAINSSEPLSALFWIRLVMCLAVPQAVLFYLLIHTMPSHKIILNMKQLLLLAVLTIIAMLTTISPYLFTDLEFINNSPVPTPGPGFLIFLPIAVGSVLLGFITLVKKYIKAESVEKIQFKYIFLGILSMFILILTINLSGTLVFKNTSFVSFSSLYTLPFIISVAYTIIKHRLLDIRLVLARTVTYTLLLILSGFVYLGVLTVITAFFSDFLAKPQTAAITTVLMAVIISFTFQYVKKLFEKITDKVFYKDKYEPRKVLYNLTYIMASTISLEELTHTLLQQVIKELRINHGMFILMEDGNIYTVAHEGFTHTPELDQNMFEKLARERKMIIFDELSEGDLKESMRMMELGIVISLNTENKTIGLLALGEKLTGDIYSEADINVLEIFAPEAAVAIENSKSYEEIKRFNITLTDEIDKATKNLQEANTRLKEVDNLKDEFVSLASHELRTPMTAIKSYLWLFLENKDLSLNEKQRTYIERAYQATDRLINLVNDMLNVSRIESGRMNILIKPLNLAKLLGEVVEELRPTTLKQQVNLNLDVEEEKLPDVSGDQNKIREVIINLIGNSLKFTTPGGNISIKLYQENNTLITQIKDTGKGISQEDLSKLFQKFQTVGNNYLTKLNSQGTGLGLYLSKSIIEMHGGKIWAESEGEGKGSTFSFSLNTVSDNDTKNSDSNIPSSSES